MGDISRHMGDVLNILLVSCFFFAGDLHADKASTSNQAPSTKENDLSKLSSEFMRLREIPGHFNGGAWNAEVDSWMGTKHKVMIALAQKLDHDPYLLSDVIFYMGQPDHIIKQDDSQFEQINDWSFTKISTAAPPDAYLIYEWRGDHDFLIFACRKDHVLFSIWRYPWE